MEADEASNQRNPIQKQVTNMIKTSIAAALALALAAGSAMAEFKDFTINGELVTKAQQEAVATEVLANSGNPHQAMMDNTIEEQVKDMIIETKVMSAYARKQGLDKDPAVQDQIARATDMILMQQAVNQYLKNNPVKEEQIKAEYDKDAKRWGDKEVRIRHILVATEDEAKALIDQINKGASFAKLAAEKTLDDGSKDVGGILDWQSPSVYTGELSMVISGLKKGEMAKAPVKSPAGFHVVKVEDTRKAQLYPKYEERKMELRHMLMQRHVKAFIHDQVLGADIKDAK